MILNLLPFLVTTFAGGTEPTGTSIQSVFDPSLPITMQATLQGEDGRTWTLDLHRHSVRADNYRVLEQQRDGSFIEVEPGPVNTYRGILAGQPNTRVVAAVVAAVTKQRTTSKLKIGLEITGPIFLFSTLESGRYSLTLPDHPTIIPG